MSIRRHILFLVIMLSLLGTAVRAQYVAVVCTGDTGVAFMVDGWENSTFNWTVEGGIITRDYGDSIIVNWPEGPGEYEVTVREISEYGCAGELKRALVLVTGPELDLGGDRSICSGDQFTLDPGGGFEFYQWHDGSHTAFYTTGEEGWIVLEVADAAGCRARDSIYLTVNPLPVVDLGSDTSLCGSQSLDLDAGNDGMIYTWSTGDHARIITVYAGYQKIWVEVENEFGCVSTDEIIVEECDLENYFRGIPTAITPNNDGVNDVWNMYRLMDYPEAVIEIFDRWGTLVWRSEPGYSNPWDGRNMNGNLVPMDSYHFVIQFNNTAKDQIVGIITVIR